MSDIASAIASLATYCGRECGGESLKEVWLSEAAYDTLALEILRGSERDLDNKTSKYNHGLLELYLPIGKVRIRRAD